MPIVEQSLHGSSQGDLSYWSSGHHKQAHFCGHRLGQLHSEPGQIPSRELVNTTRGTVETLDENMKWIEDKFQAHGDRIDKLA